MKVIYSPLNAIACTLGCLTPSFGPGSESSNLLAAPVPAIVVETSPHHFDAKERVPVSITLISSNSPQQCGAELSIRGSSSAKREKKPYRLELQDQNGDDLKLSLLGMPKESDWVLYPAYTDKTMIRDALAYELWRQMGYWAPRSRYVHLFIFTNSSSLPSRPSVEKDSRSSSSTFAFPSLPPFPSVEENSDFASFRDFRGDAPGYEGVYILMEKIKRGKNRVNIQKLPRASPASSIRDQAASDATHSPTNPSIHSSVDPVDISGGYIFKKDRHNSTNETPFRTLRKVDLILEEPKVRDITPEQLSWFTNHINEFEIVLFSDSFADPLIGYSRYVDVDSFVDYHWMQELGKNSDAYWFSELYHKDRADKIRIGPIWDFDMAFGNTYYNGGHLTNDWRWTHSTPQHYRWYKRMFQDPDFLQRYIDRWSELRTNVLSNSNVLALIDRFAAEIAEAQKLNYQRWPTLGKKIGTAFFVGQTWEEEVHWLKDWMVGRLAWIDSQDFPKPIFQILTNSPSRPLPSFAGSSQPPLLSVSSLASFPSVENSALRAPHSALEGSSFILQPSSFLSLSCDPAAGSIFYTTNNTDPRAFGGHASTNAIHYTAPIPITPGLQVRARVLSDFGLWSAPALYP